MQCVNMATGEMVRTIPPGYEVFWGGILAKIGKIEKTIKKALRSGHIIRSK